MEALINSLNNVYKPVVEVKLTPVLLNCCTPVVELHDLKNDWVPFDEDEWRWLLENQCVISNFL